jgi:hypothetical protein
MKLNFHYYDGQVFDLDQKTMCKMIDDVHALRKANETLIEALEKIADPRKRDHNEPDAYTTLGCVMNIADLALTEYKGAE